jgi:hypothetical protein
MILKFLGEHSDMKSYDCLSLKKMAWSLKMKRGFHIMSIDPSVAKLAGVLLTIIINPEC